MDTKLAHLSGFVVSPAERLRNAREKTTIQASSLTICTSRKKDGHFEIFDLPPRILRTLKAKFVADYSRSQEQEHVAKILETSASIVRHKARLKDGDRNEAGVRYAVCNEVLSLICDVYHLKLSLEDKVSQAENDEDIDSPEEYIRAIRMLYEPPSETEPSENVPSENEETDHLNETIGHKMSPQNKADYCVYRCQSSQSQVVAIIDAKAKYSAHSIAQVIGYYSACHDVCYPPPVVAILTSNDIQFVLFPFKKDGTPLVNAVVFTPISIWTEDNMRPDFSVLTLILSIMSDRSEIRNYTVHETEFVPNFPVLRSQFCDIVTDAKAMKDLEEENRRQKEENRRQKEENRRQKEENRRQKEELKQLKMRLGMIEQQGF